MGTHSGPRMWGPTEDPECGDPQRCQSSVETRLSVDQKAFCPRSVSTSTQKWLMTKSKRMALNYPRDSMART